MRTKQNKPARITRKGRQYSNESMVLAYQAVKEKGWNVVKAAISFGVPIQTLRDRTRGAIDPLSCKTGANTTLSKGEEESLVEHAELMAQLGYGITNRHFQHLAGDLLHSLGRKKNNKPLSNNWLYGFLTRWRQRIVSVRPRKLDTTRAKSSTPEAVDSYFKNLGAIMTKFNFQEKPHLIFNVDETGLQPDHRPPNIIAASGSKPQAVTSPRSTTTTLIGCASAVGQSIPPYFIFKGKRFNEDLLNGATAGTRGVMSDSGWSNSNIFKKYLQDHFLPHVGGGGTEEDPILLILDGHASHVSTNLIDWAKEHHLILFVLPAHTSHILQPLDVAIFGPFKTYYYQECATFMQKNMGQCITRYDITRLSCKAYCKAMSPLNIQAAFKKSGILPLDRNIVSQEKLFPCESFRDDQPLQKISAIKSGKEAVDEFLRLKVEASQISTSETCQCLCKKRKQSSKPKPGGRAITDDDYLQDLISFETDKEINKTPAKTTKLSHQPRQLNFTQASSPRPSTSGTHIPPSTRVPDVDLTDTDYVDEIDDDVPCCVCGKITPPTLREQPNVKIVSWAQCDSCNHWVHLTFCTSIRVVRRHSQFLCIHCQS